MPAPTPLQQTIELTAAGENGSAIGDATSLPVAGFVHCIRVEFESDQADTANVTITDTFLGVTLADITKSATTDDAITLYPRFPENDPDGTALDTKTLHFVSSRTLAVALTGANVDSTRAVTVKLQMLGAEFGG